MLLHAPLESTRIYLVEGSLRRTREIHRRRAIFLSLLNSQTAKSNIVQVTCAVRGIKGNRSSYVQELNRNVQKKKRFHSRSCGLDHGGGNIVRAGGHVKCQVRSVGLAGVRLSVGEPLCRYLCPQTTEALRFTSFLS